MLSTNISFQPLKIPTKLIMTRYNTQGKTALYTYNPTLFLIHRQGTHSIVHSPKSTNFSVYAEVSIKIVVYGEVSIKIVKSCLIWIVNL
jgi:hypothetical protein